MYKFDHFKFISYITLELTLEKCKISKIYVLLMSKK